MSASYPITTSLKVVKQLQFVKEIIAGTTPTSPLFVAIPSQQFTPTITTDHIKLTKIGAKADIYKEILIRKNYELSIDYSPINDNLLASMINVTGTPDSRDDTYTFLISQMHNSDGVLAEQYQIATGSSPSQVTISLDDGELIRIESDWIVMNISDWNVSHNLSGTPSFASELTATPWAATTTGSSPLSFDELDYDIRTFSCTVNHNVERIQITGQSQVARIVPNARDISLEFSVVYKDNVISEDVKTLTPRVLNIQLYSTEPPFPTIIALQFTDVWLDAYDETIDAESTDAKVISYSGSAATIALLSSIGTADVLQSSIHKYDVVGIGTPVSQTSIHKYNMAGNVLANSIHKYHMSGAISNTSIHKYNILKNIVQTTIQKYNLLANAVQTNIHKYNLLANILQTSIHKFDIAGSGPTRFYFHAATNSTSGLPTSEQSSITADQNLEGSQTTNRMMTTTIGSGETSIAALGGTNASAQNIYVTRFVSAALNMSSISANTWTYSFAAEQDSASNNYPVTGTNQPVRVNCYVWRPSNSTKVGTILDGNTASTVDEPAADTKHASTTTFSGSAVSSMQSGDVLILEIWFQNITRLTSANMLFYYDGTTVTTTDGTVTNHASFLETPDGLIFV